MSVVLRLGLTVLVFMLPMTIGLWAAKHSHQDELIQRSESVATRAVLFMDELVNLAEQSARDALPLLNESCDQGLPTLRKLAAFQPFLRSVNLVRNDFIVCSSLMGATRRPNTGASEHQWMWLEEGNWVRAGVPILVVYAARGRDGVRIVIDAEAIDFMVKFSDPLVQTQLHVGDTWLSTKKELSVLPPSPSNRTALEVSSKRYPFSVYASVNASSTWPAVLATHSKLLGVVFILSMVLAGGVYRLLGRPRSFHGELARGLRAREFVPYFQPIMDRHGQRLVGVEVLMRWQHPSGELIRPDLFIPLAEESGLICAMTAQLMEGVGEVLACRIARLPAGFQVGFNISASHCQDDALLHECRRFLSRFAPGAVQLVLELTERELFMDDAHSLSLFKRLDSLGVKLAIDDFGTGHSSFSYLQKFHVHCLKIDRSFVNLIGKESLSGHIIDNVVDLANRLNLELVAEGVETREQADYLAARGVHMMQGYLYGKPVPFNDFILEHSLADQECQNCSRCTPGVATRAGQFTAPQLRKEGL